MGKKGFQVTKNIQEKLRHKERKGKERIRDLRANSVSKSVSVRAATVQLIRESILE